MLTNTAASMNWMLAAAMAIGMVAPPRARAADMLVYFGSQATTGGIGFSIAHFDTVTGALSQPKFLVAADGPSIFAIGPDNRHLYTTNFTGDGGASAYRIDLASGALTLINRISGNKASTSYLGLDRSGRFALAANFDTGHLAVFPIEPDGSLGKATAIDKHTGSSVNPQRQTHTYPHDIVTDPSNRFAVVPDLGIDKVYVYRFDDKAGTLVAADPPSVSVKPGSGPRHVAFSPNQKWAYVITEMGNTIIAFKWDAARGTLSEIQTVSTLPDGFTAESTAAEIEVHPGGKFLFGSNRGHDSIVTFAIDPSNGRLTLVAFTATQGKNPRDFTLDPSGKWMICTNQASNSAIVFRIDAESGKLTPVGPPVDVPAPCGVRMVAAGAVGQG